MWEVFVSANWLLDVYFWLSFVISRANVLGITAGERILSINWDLERYVFGKDFSNELKFRIMIILSQKNSLWHLLRQSVIFRFILHSKKIVPRE